MPICVKRRGEWVCSFLITNAVKIAEGESEQMQVAFCVALRAENKTRFGLAMGTEFQPCLDLFNANLPPLDGIEALKEATEKIFALLDARKKNADPKITAEKKAELALKVLPRRYFL